MSYMIKKKLQKCRNTVENACNELSLIPSHAYMRDV